MQIVTQAEVIDKNTNSGKDRNGFDVTYYNLKLADREKCETQLIGVPADVYEQVEVGKIYRFGGSFGGLKTKWWKFDQFLGEVKSK